MYGSYSIIHAGRKKLKCCFTVHVEFTRQSIFVETGISLVLDRKPIGSVYDVYNHETAVHLFYSLRTEGAYRPFMIDPIISKITQPQANTRGTDNLVPGGIKRQVN